MDGWPQPYHPAAQDRLPTEVKQGWAGQYLDGRPPEKTGLLLEEVVVSIIHSFIHSWLDEYLLFLLCR